MDSNHFISIFALFVPLVAADSSLTYIAILEDRSLNSFQQKYANLWTKAFMFATTTKNVSCGWTEVNLLAPSGALIVMMC